MAASRPLPVSLIYLLSVFLLALAMTCAAAARILEEEETAPATAANNVAVPAIGAGPAVPAAGAGPAAAAAAAGADPDVPANDAAPEVPAAGAGPGVPAAGAGPGVPAAGAGLPVPAGGAGLPVPAAGAGLPVPAAGAGLPVPAAGAGLPVPAAGADPAIPAAGAGPAVPAAGAGPAVPGAAVGPAGAAPGAAGAAASGEDPDHTLTFFMHDILGGSHPSARAVTGIVSNQAVTGSVAFAKPNGANLPLNNGGVPVGDTDNGYINNNNVPLLTGLNGITANTVQNGNNNNPLTGFSAVSGGELPAGAAVQKLMFGTITVIDDELTEGHKRGSGLIGKAQGFYVASSVDGTSQTMAFTAMFQSGGYKDSISFFGVHRTAVSESHLAIMGGTGKYSNAKGFALMRTISAANQHETDGVETLVEFTVYLS